MKLLDVAGPADVFADGEPVRCRTTSISMVSVDGADVRASMGLADAGGLSPAWGATAVSGPPSCGPAKSFPAGEVDRFARLAPLSSSGGRTAQRRSVRAPSFWGLRTARREAGDDALEATCANWRPRYPPDAGRGRRDLREGSQHLFLAGVTAAIDLALALLEEDEEIELDSQMSPVRWSPTSSGTGGQRNSPEVCSREVPAGIPTARGDRGGERPTPLPSTPATRSGGDRAG